MRATCTVCLKVSTIEQHENHRLNLPWVFWTLRRECHCTMSLIPRPPRTVLVISVWDYMYSHCFFHWPCCYLHYLYTDSETHFKVVVVSETFEGMSLLKVCTCREWNHFRPLPFSVLIAYSKNCKWSKNLISWLVFLSFSTVASQTGNGHTKGGDGKGGRSTHTVHSGQTSCVQWSTSYMSISNRKQVLVAMPTSCLYTLITIPRDAQLKSCLAQFILPEEQGYAALKRYPSECRIIYVLKVTVYTPKWFITHLLCS